MLKTKCFNCGKDIKINEEKETTWGIAPKDFPEHNIQKGDRVYFCKKCARKIGEESLN